MAKIAHKLNIPQLNALLASPSGPVTRDLFRRGKKVEAAAKRNLERDPRRINTGTLRSSIHTTIVNVGGHVAVQVGSNLFYAVYVHDGTGLYGPKGIVIRPTTAKVLRWRGKGGYVFAQFVKGMKPNPFLKDALPAAKG